ncbi:MAG: FixH family protein, partial [Pseudomonadota bacterium]
MNAALHPKPWYREPWPWFLMSLPATAVIAGVATVVIAIQSADGMVVGDYYKAGLAINQTLARDNAATEMALT